MLEQVIGKKSVTLDPQTLRDKVAGYSAVHIDLGCGDGMLPYRRARQNADIFYIGIDADRDSLADASAKAAKKPARGGAENVAFLCMNLLPPQQGLEGIADKLLFNFPWGSLMRAVVEPDVMNLKAMAAMGKPNAAFELYLNLYVFENETQRQNMNLPVIDEVYVKQTLAPGWTTAGLAVERTQFVPPEALKDHPSTWAGRLVRRSGRNTLHMEGHIHG